VPSGERVIRVHHELAGRGSRIMAGSANKEPDPMPHTCEEAKAKALAGYLDPGPGHLNCAQAILLFGLLAMDRDPGSIDIAGYLGGGMARMGETCGALSGAAVTLGLRKQAGLESAPGGHDDTFEFLQGLFRDFEQTFGAVRCRGLVCHDISTAQGFREAKRSQALSRCPEFVTWTMDRLAPVLCTPGAQCR
jgi:C_GCAxxG_C_C family probable redox protein